MKFLFKLVFILILINIDLAFADSDPLFINLTTNEAHRALMGINFGKNQLERGHPLTIFLNDKGVLLGSKKNAAEFADQQKAINEVIEKGANVIICKMCLKHYEIAEDDLITGMKISNPDISGSLLFKDDTKTLSW